MDSLHPKQSKGAAHPTYAEQNIAVMIVLWVMLAGICVVAANAWAAGWIA